VRGNRIEAINRRHCRQALTRSSCRADVDARPDRRAHAPDV
jgi:hypothetical protein